MNTRQLEYVIAVAEEGSFSKAAKRLIISQPSLSQYIQKLEQDLGTEIFIRTSPLRLTTEGKVYVKMAKRILYEESIMKQTISDIVNDKVGELVIGAGPFNNACIIPYAVGELQKKYPHIKVIMKETLEPNLIDMLDRGGCDIILTTTEIDNLLDEYEVIELHTEEYFIAVPEVLDPYKERYEIRKKELPIGKYPSIRVEDIKELPFIFIEDKDIMLHKILEGLCKMEGIIPKTQIDCANITTVLRLIAIGAGIGVVPSSAAYYGMGAKIHYYSNSNIRKSRKLKVVFNKDKYLPKSADYFINQLIELDKNNNIIGK